MKVVGMMSGTSMDGLDCCYADINIDNNYILSYEIIHFETFSFSESLIKLIISSLGNKNKSAVDKTNDELGKFFLNCCNKFINDDVDLISLHGQTISHTNAIESIQIGNPKYLSKYYNIPIIYDFRTQDIRIGGNGAPLVPFLDWLLYKESNENIVTLNIGGISNISFIPNDGLRNKVIGFDTGPGMCLIDEFVNIIWNKRIDYNAQYSSLGNINTKMLGFLMNNKFINSKPPKSTSIEYYNKSFLNEVVKKFDKISYYDITRTLVNFTAKSVAFNISKFLNNKSNFKLFISGGGARHPVLMRDLNKYIKCKGMKMFSENNLNVDSKESFLIAIMGYTKFHNIPNNMKTVTGASELSVYGEIYE